MRLTYPHPPEVGTIVAHMPHTTPDVRRRFLAIDETGMLYTADGLTEVHRQSQPGNTHPPRSVVEHYIVRRTRTPYGYAKVWGQTPPCHQWYVPTTENVTELHDIERWKAEAAAQRCADWWRERHPDPTENRPTGRQYLKKIQQLYKEMTHG